MREDRALSIDNVLTLPAYAIQELHSSMFHIREEYSIDPQLAMVLGSVYAQTGPMKCSTVTHNGSVRFTKLLESSVLFNSTWTVDQTVHN